MPSAHAAAVPLICDPVPGPPAFITIDRVLSIAEAEQFRRAWEEGARSGRANPVNIIGLDARFQIAPPGARTEWPDAEFCAA